MRNLKIRHRIHFFENLVPLKEKAYSFNFADEKDKRKMKRFAEVAKKSINFSGYVTSPKLKGGEKYLLENKQNYLTTECSR